MTITPVTLGRGAFSTYGKDNGKRYYQFVSGTLLDGSNPTKNVNYQAVNLGVKALQTRINSYGLGYAPRLVVDGVFGKQTAAAVRAAQGALGLVEDGVAGPATCRALWRDLLIWFGGVHNVPASQLYGFMMLESIGDPGAVGYTTPSDRGLNQINLIAHPTITVEQAFNPYFSIDYTANRLELARLEFSGKSADLKTKASIAQHNSPVAAAIWYRDGVPPLGPVIYNGKTWPGWPNIEKYVNSVLGHAANFK